MVHGVLPENQLLRSWDNVPRKAKAQEVSGNRLIYGNYLQNYDLLDGDNIITPSLTIGLRHYDVSKDGEDLSPEQVYPTDSYKYSPSKSVKSLRTYQLGITYVDKYGRETSVLTDNNEKQVSTYLNEWYSDKQVKITGQVNNTPPDWAEYQKFFIKETSSEYYNLALDRWYNAEDGNIWLSFPSSERNKVDIDTYLILKKEHDENAPILEEARYDILAIENEAPDFIKTREIPIGNCSDDGSNNDTFGPNSGVGFPAKNLKFFEIHGDRFNEKIVLTSQETKGDIFVRFKITNVYTKWYEITNVTDNTMATPSPTWILDLAVEFGDDINILTTNPNSPYTNKRTPITAEFMQKRLENKAEFDGRFFAKIYSDGILRGKVAKANNSTTAYGIVQAELVQYISPTGYNAPSTTGMKRIWYGWGITNGLARYYDGSGGVFPAQLQNGTIVDTRGISNQTSTNQWSSTDPANSTITQNIDTGKQFWQGVNDNTSGFFIDNCAGYLQWNASIAGGSIPEIDDVNVSTGQGVDSSGWWLHLSYSGFLDGDGVQSSSYMLSNASTTHLDQIRFISTLTTAGTIWKWGEDPDETVYITTQTNWGQGVPYWNFARPQISTSGYIEMPWWIISQPVPNNNAHGSYDYEHRNRWAVNAKALVTGGKLGSGPHGYLPTNDATNTNSVPRFDHLGNVITEYPAGYPGGLAGTSLMGTQAPGIRIDGMANGLTALDGSGTSFTIPSEPQRWNSATVTSANDHTRPPGSVTWQILEPISTQSLTYSSHNPAVFETEPKENLDLEIYHEVGQIYPLEYNRKTNELYTPVGSVVTCWRSINAPWVLNNPTWNPTSGGYPGTDPIPVGNINIGGNPSQASFLNPWVGPIIVSNTQDDTVILVDDSGAAFNSNTNWPEVHIVPGDHLKFIRPDGSSTSAIVTTISGNVYTIDANISNRTMTLPWFNSYSFGNGVESNRIRDDYNQVTIDKGPKVSSILDEPYKEERRSSGLIYSGIYNSMSGVNNLNQFIQAEKITKDLNPTFGSIQKLFQRHINLITFCEDKVVKILSNKDALYNADGNANLTATNRVLGDAQPYVGDFGISKNPESFASENYRAYFTDKQRGVVLRLSKDGLTSISDHGMVDWFRDKLPLSDRLIGGFDIQKREYNITLPDIARTLSFREDVRGWVSFKSFIPENSISLAGKYYTFNKGNAWKHHDSTVNFNTFYGVTPTPSHVTTIFNTDPKSVKNFQTLNYEGSQSRVDQLVEYVNPNDGILYTDSDYHNLESDVPGWYVESIHTDMQDGTLKEFIKKEGKWFNYIRGEEIPVSVTGQVASGTDPGWFDYDPNEFSWQGIGLADVSLISLTQNGGCTDVLAANYGCSTTLHPAWSTPCMGDSPDINGVCRDGTLCNSAGCCGTNNGYDAIDYDDGSCTYTNVIYGCLNNVYSINYDCANGNTSYPCNDGVTHDDGSCIGVQGCTDPNLTTNYDPTATLDCNGHDITLQGYTPQPGWDQCCIAMVFGCLHSSQFNYAPTANTPCNNSNSGCFPPNCNGPGQPGFGGCCEARIYGCMDSSAINFHSGANTPHDGTQGVPCAGGQTILTNPLGCSCVYPVLGCTDNTSILADGSNGTWPDTNGFGTDAIYDCTSATPNIPTNISTINTCSHPCSNGYWADNYNPCANSPTTCSGPGGCMNSTANNYDANAYYDDGSCSFGCCNTLFSISNYNLILALGPGNTCSTSGIGVEFKLTITQPDGFTYTDPNTNNSYFNFTGVLATASPTTLAIDSGVLAAQGNGIWRIEVDYTFPGTSIPLCSTILTQAVIVGCTDNTSGPNPDINGNCNTGAPCNTLGCCGGTTGYSAEQYDPTATVNDGSCTYPIFGCTDGGSLHPNYVNQSGVCVSGTSCAENYNPAATVDDGSCLYQGCTTANNASGAYASNYNAYYNLDCNGEPIGTNNGGYDSCCNFGTVSCTNSAIGCHPDIYGGCHSGPNATSGCVGTGCCGYGNGYEKTNYDPICDADPNCGACTTCCTATSLSGCGMQYLNPPNASIPTFNYDPCVDVNDPSMCLPTVYGCMDSTALNYGSYSQSNPFGTFSGNTNFGTNAPMGNTGNTFNYIMIGAHNYSGSITTQLVAGSLGPNTSSGPAGCGGINNPCNNCIYPVYGCTDPTANNYDGGATLNQISQTNTNSPCCYSSGCIMPNALAVLPAGSLPTITAVNLNTTGCVNFISGSGPTNGVSDCYGNMVDVSSMTIDGDANGTTIGNGWQFGNNNIPIALNGGNTCADGNCDLGTVGTAAHLLQNQDGYFDPGGHGTGGLNASGQTLTINWTNWPSANSFVSSGTHLAEDCCDYYDGCSDPCASNYNPSASVAASAQTCVTPYNAYCSVTGNGVVIDPPPWNNEPNQWCCDPPIQI
jgi:hypothetical protein